VNGRHSFDGHFDIGFRSIFREAVLIIAPGMHFLCRSSYRFPWRHRRLALETTIVMLKNINLWLYSGHPPTAAARVVDQM
jgi:hypothetical protein